MIQYLPFRWILCSNQKHQIQYIINLFTINWSNRYYSNSTFLINNFFEKSTGIFYSLEELITICCNNNVRKVHEVINLGDEDEELALGFVVWIAAGFESSEKFWKIYVNFTNVADPTHQFIHTFENMNFDFFWFWIWRYTLENSIMRWIDLLDDQGTDSDSWTPFIVEN